MKLFEHPQIVISQKAKVIELTNEYKISDPEGQRDRGDPPGGPIHTEEGGPVSSRRSISS